MAYVPGYDKAATFQLDGAGSATTLAIRSWSWAENVQKLVTTHTGTSGKAACIAGVLDGEGDVEANLDAAALPCATAPGIKAGAKGSITFAVGGSTTWIIHVMVTRVNWRSAVDALVTYSFSVALDYTTTTYTYPT